MIVLEAPITYIEGVQTAELALETVRRHANVFAERAPEASLGRDHEDIHQARVATRRLRAALRVFREALPAEANELRAELKWIATHLGAVRDLDVQLARLERNSADLALADDLAPYRGRLGQQRQTALDAYREAFESPRCGHLIGTLHKIAETSIEHTEAIADQGAVEDYARRELKRAWRRLRKRAYGMRASSPDPAFHPVRIAAKRLRYTTEFFEPLYGKPAHGLIAAATDLQDLLGDLQDGIVDTRLVFEAIQAEGDGWRPETALALGQIVQMEIQHASEIRGQFKRAYRDVEDGWERLGKVL